MTHLMKAELARKHDKEGEISIDELVATMINCASILADCLIADVETEDPEGFTWGLDDSWYDYIPSGLDVVAAVLAIWRDLVNDDGHRWNRELGRGEELYFQDNVPPEAKANLAMILKNSGFVIQEES